MLIKKIQVEGGFLQGVEADFTPGLNAVIGSRGTGKSSLVELIRYSLGIKRYIKTNQTGNDTQAVQILEDGIVTLVIEDDGNQYELVSTASRVAEKPLITSRWPLIFSQTDIESIGLDPQSRVKLIDGFIKDRELYISKKNTLKDAIKISCDKLRKLQVEVDSEQDNNKKEKLLLDEITKLQSMQSGYNNLNNKFVLNNDKLNMMINEISLYHVDEERLKNVSEELTRLNNLQGEQHSIITELNEKPTPRFLDNALTMFKDKISENMLMATHTITKFKQVIDETRWNINDAINKLNEESFRIRSEIETFESGSGDINRKIMNIMTNLSLVQEEIKNSSKSKERFNEEKTNLTKIVEELIAIDEGVFKRRIGIVDYLNDKLNKSIKIKGLHANNTFLYADAFEHTFRNSSSNLKYKDILDDLASSVSKKELLNIVFNQDIDSISLFLGTSKQRSLSIISALTFDSIAKILMADIEDTFEFYLLDNGIYKPFTNLSVGQRCTVILPIILQNDNQVVILDQPEDHIDNAFIAETLIPSILECARTGQLIIITHNANIPVLGAANNIIHLESDGKRGYIKDSGELNNKTIISTISRIMEGGQQAFNTRAGFYSK